MEAIITYKGSLAYFSIKRERPGIYQADLIYYDGEEGKKPPTGITLLRGVREWTGSENDKILMNQLGKIINESFDKSAQAK